MSAFDYIVDHEGVAIRGRTGYLPGGIALYESLTGERLLDYLAELTGRPPVRRQELCARLELSPRPQRKRRRECQTQHEPVPG